jgi:hypothetical protein
MRMVVFAASASDVRPAVLHEFVGRKGMASWTGSSNWSGLFRGVAWTATPALELFYKHTKNEFRTLLKREVSSHDPR